MSTSKETAVGILIANTMTMFFLKNTFTKKGLLRLLPFLLITLYTVFRVGYASLNGVERQPELGFFKLFHNWTELSRFSGFLDLKVIVLLFLTSLIISGLKTRHLVFNNKFKILFILALFQFVFCSLVILQLNGVYLRYAHPLLPVNFFLTFLILLYLLKVFEPILATKKTIGINRIVLIFSFSWFFLAHYHNFIYQFASQHRARIADKNLLDRLEQLIGPNGTILVIGEDEIHGKIQGYFDLFLPYFYGKNTHGIRLTGVHFDLKEANNAIYAVSEKDGAPNGFQHFERLNNPAHYPLLKYTHKISRLMRYPRHIEQWEDSGSPSIEYWAWWDIYKREN